jgi:micrococcal nuclease
MARRSKRTRFPKFTSLALLILLVVWFFQNPQEFLKKLSTAFSQELSYHEKSPSPDSGTKNIKSNHWYRVVRVIDGDTLLLERKIRVRLIGVDTPEKYESTKLYRDALRTKTDVKVIRELGKEASNFVKRLIQAQKVRLEFEANRKDDYGRTLAYVYFEMPEEEFFKRVQDPNQGSGQEKKYMLNRVLVQYGYAHAYTKFPFEYRAEFIQLEKIARGQGRGLWGEDFK